MDFNIGNSQGHAPVKSPSWTLDCLAIREVVGSRTRTVTFKFQPLKLLTFHLKLAIFSLTLTKLHR